jgi:hypothetical protein
MDLSEKARPLDNDSNNLDDVFRAPVRRGRSKTLPKLAPAQSEVDAPHPNRTSSLSPFADRPESDDVCAFLTVYALNACVMLFAFPVGMVLLVYNILAGENLRTSAHVMGLTGLMTALPLIGTPVPFIA